MLYEYFVEPWTTGAWMWRGVLTASLAGVSCAILGCFLYLRNMSLLGDALAHVALPGIIAAYLMTGSDGTLGLLVGAMVAAGFSSGLIHVVETHVGTRPDAAIGIVFTTLFAVGVILLSTVASDAHIDTACVLFGDVLGVADHSIVLLGVVCLFVVAVVAIFYKPLQLATFDPGFARAVGLPVTLISAGFLVTLSVATVASFEAVGAILVVAAVITPASTAHLLARRLPSMLLIAVGHALFSALSGMYVSVWINCSTGGAMVTIGAFLYALAFAVTRVRERLRIAKHLTQIAA